MSNLQAITDHVELIHTSLLLRSPGDETTARELADRLAAARERISTRPLVEAIDRLSLSETEQLVVWLLVAVALRRDVRALANAALGECTVDPTLEGIRQIVYGGVPTASAFSELSASGRLRRLGIIQRTDGHESAHETRQTWAVARRVLTAVLGSVECDSAISELVIERCVPERSELALPETCLEAIARALTIPNAIVTVHGPTGSGRRSALIACARPTRTILAVDLRKAKPDLSGFREQVRAIALECALQRAIPLACGLDATLDDKGERQSILLRELGALVQGQIFVTSRNLISLDVNRPLVSVEIEPPSHAQRARLWLSTLGAGTEADGDVLANRFPLAAALIVRAGTAARTCARDGALSAEDIYPAIRDVLDEGLGAYARRVKTTQSWDDIVLPADQIDRIVELMARVRGRHEVYERWGFAAKVGKGLGVSALFSGPPGTGKTMVAGLIAKELGLDLFQVDMAKIVSKFIGETERNLAALFDAAEAAHAILLFDEADSLFGKRTDVRSSNDRFANQETNYLLQRLESFTGICILTSNHESSIDPAFQRRLSLHLRFELPDIEERAAMWRAVLPSTAPIADGIDYAHLARKYEMSGGYIRNAVLRAAFIASDRREPITGALLERAARVEYEGMGKLAA